MTNTIRIDGPPLHKGGHCPTCWKCKKPVDMLVISFMTNKATVLCHSDKQIVETPPGIASETFQETWYCSTRDCFAFHPTKSFMKLLNEH